MLFYLKDSLIVDDSNSLDLNIYRAIRNLATAAESGKHLLLGDYNIISKAKDIFREDKIIGPLFNKLLNNFYINVVPQFITYYIEIVKDNPQERDDNGKKIVQVKYDVFLDDISLMPTNLIGEDLNDCLFYRHILKCYTEKQQISSIFNFQDIYGGGVRTCDVIKQDIKNKHFSICILDTDKKYPSYKCKSDSTYGKCKRFINKYPFLCLLPLNVQEIENIIPLNYIDTFDVWKTEKCKYNKRFFDYLKNDAENILPFFDFKKGIKKNGEYMIDVKYQNFAERCFNINSELKSNYNNYQEYIDDINEEDTIYPGLINGILSKTLDYIRTTNCDLPILLEYQKIEWIKISISMLNWGISRSSESLN